MLSSGAGINRMVHSCVDATYEQIIIIKTLMMHVKHILEARPVRAPGAVVFC